jgi:general secretion pathway protein A
MNETFYGGFYGFQSAPFHITPDPTLLFPTETHRAALGAIEYGITAGKGFIVVTGEVGVGKTTVLRVCLDALEPNKTKIIYLFSPALNTTELYATLLEEFDVTLPTTTNAADMLRMLQRILLAVHHSDTQVVLAVDEAQQMPEATLESLRILSNLETHKSKLLQIILVGQPELEAVLAKHSMRQLAQRVAVRARVRPLTFRQSCRYIAHRTRCAGRAANRPLFTTPALLYLAFVAGGIPRSINICCDNALINGYGHAAERISFRIVREACKAMKFRSPLRRAAALTAAAMVLVGLFVTGNALLRHFYAARAESVPAAAQARPAGNPVEIPEPGRTIAKPLVANPPQPAPAGAPDRPGTDPNAGSADPNAGNSSTVTASDGASAAAAGAGAAEAPKPASAAAEATAPAAPQTSPPEPPAALRPAPAGAASASPFPWVSSDDSSSGEAHAASHSVPEAHAASNSVPQAHAASNPVPEARQTSRSVSRWVVREGDTVYKVCRVTYGSCDPRTLHEVIAANPKLSRDTTIYLGEVLLLPKHLSAGSN